MARGLHWLTLACVLSSLLIAPEADARRRKADEPRIRDLHYGEVLFHFYQGDDFGAITRLLAARRQERLEHHATEAELLLGGMYVSYGQQADAEAIFTRLLAQEPRPAARDRAWFFLAKIAYQRQQPERAARALAQVGRELDPDLEAQRQLLASRLEMDAGRFDEAARLLERWRGADAYLDYARYNMGVALVRSGDVQRGTRWLKRIGAGQEDPQRAGFWGSLGGLTRVFTPWRLLQREGAIETDLTYEEHEALADQANVALGFAFLQDGNADEAVRYLSRVDEGSPWAARARLGTGWAHAALGDYDEALTPWRALEQGDPYDPAVQEAWLAVPYALGKLEDYPAAVSQYTAAIDTFSDEMQRIDRVAREAGTGGFLGELLASMESDDLGWFWQLERLPDTEQTRYLYRLLADHSFQEALKNYRDLRLLSNNLQGWHDGVDAYRNMLETRRTRFEERSQLMGEALASGRLEALDARAAALASRLERIRAEGDALGLASPEEQRQLQTLDEVGERLARLPQAAGKYTQTLAELRHRQRVLRGLLEWRLSQEYAARLWEQTRAHRELVAALAEAHARTDALVAAREETDERLARFAARVDAIVPRVATLRARIGGLQGDHGRYIAQLAEATLEARRQRLAAYLTEAQYALASVYDSAAHGEGQ